MNMSPGMALPCSSTLAGLVPRASFQRGSMGPIARVPCPVWIKIRNPASVAVQRERIEKWNR
jgi:hypothetical protein